MKTRLTTVQKKYKAMTDEQRLAALLKNYPSYMLENDDNHLRIWEDDVCVTIDKDGRLVNVEYCANDRY